MPIYGILDGLCFVAYVQTLYGICVKFCGVRLGIVLILLLLTTILSSRHKGKSGLKLLMLMVRGFIES